MNVIKNRAKPPPSRGKSKRPHGKQAETVAARSAKAKRGTGDGCTKSFSTSSTSATKGSRFDGVPGSIELLCELRTAPGPQRKSNNIDNDIVGRIPNLADTKRLGQPWQLERKWLRRLLWLVGWLVGWLCCFCCGSVNGGWLGRVCTTLRLHTPRTHLKTPKFGFPSLPGPVVGEMLSATR